MEANWDWYRAFLGVMQTGSLSGAARALGLTQPTVGRHIDALEGALGLKLFIRTYDGYAPSEAARRLLPYAEALAASAAALTRVASSEGDGVRGTVRIAASDVVGVEVLPPILARLREAHPALTIELHLSDQLDDLLQREADIAVRMVRPSQQAVVARRVGIVQVGLFASPDYLARHGTPATVAELAGHSLVGPDGDTDWLRRLRQQFPMMARERLALRVDSNLAQLAAIRAGFGIGGCQVGLAARAPTLVRVLAADFEIKLDTWIAMHEDLRETPRCAVTFAALVEGMAAYIGASGGATA
jgi:DNA-binding transcriptional LysR family regulator